MPDEPIRAQLRKILSSDLFARSERLSRFLRFTVEQTLAGKGDSLKEYVIALGVFDKPASFDPRTDPVVRVQARRLRAALTEYYAKNGQNDPILIDLPSGGYLPSFSRREHAPEAKQRPPGRRWWFAAAGVGVLLVSTTAVVKTGTGASDRFTSIAVLPFADLSPDNDQEYLCNGFAEELIDTLTKIQTLRVPARTSSFRFKGNDWELRSLADQLKVQAVLEGSVRKSGNRLRITAQLVRVTDGSHVWSETLDREMRDIFAIQDELSTIVAARLKVHLPEKPPRTQNPEAYNACLLGRFHFNQWTRESMRKSVSYFQQAIDKDPNYALAYAGLADSNAVLAHWGAVPAQEGWSNNQRALDRALQLDPNLAEAHVVLAMRRAHFEWNWSGAERAFKRAFELNPRSTFALGSFAVVLHDLGRFAEADEQLRKALDLDPLSARLRTTQGIGRYCAHRYDQAIECFQQVLVMEPNFLQARIYLGATYTEKQMFPEALSELETARRLAPGNPETSVWLAYAYARASQRDKAIQILSQLKQVSLRQQVSAFNLAAVHVALGERERALELIEQAAQVRDGYLVRLRVDPRYDPLQSEARFQAVLKTMGLT